MNVIDIKNKNKNKININVDKIKNKIDYNKNIVTTKSNTNKKKQLTTSNKIFKTRTINQKNKLKKNINRFFLNRTVTELRGEKIKFFKYLRYVLKFENDYIPNKVFIYYNKSPHSILYSVLFPYILYLLYRNTHYIININKYWDELKVQSDKIKERDPDFNPKEMNVDKKLYETAFFRRIIYFIILLWTVSISFFIYIILHFVMEALCDNLLEFDSYTSFRSVLTIIIVILAFIFNYYLIDILISVLRVMLRTMIYLTYFIIILFVYLFTFIIYLIVFLFNILKYLTKRIINVFKKSKIDIDFKNKLNLSTSYNLSNINFNNFKNSFSTSYKINKESFSLSNMKLKVSNLSNNVKSFSLKDFINKKKLEYLNPKLKIDKVENPNIKSDMSSDSIKEGADYIKDLLMNLIKGEDKSTKNDKNKIKKKSDGCKTNVIDDFFLQFQEKRFNDENDNIKKRFGKCIDNKRIDDYNKNIDNRCKEEDEIEIDDTPTGNIDAKARALARQNKNPSRCERQILLTKVLKNFFILLSSEYIDNNKGGTIWYIKNLESKHKKTLEGKRPVPKYFTELEEFMFFGEKSIKDIINRTKKASRNGKNAVRDEINKIKKELIDTDDINRRDVSIQLEINRILNKSYDYFKGKIDNLPKIRSHMKDSYELKLIYERIITSYKLSGKFGARVQIDFMKKELKRNYINKLTFKVIKKKDLSGGNNENIIKNKNLYPIELLVVQELLEILKEQYILNKTDSKNKFFSKLFNEYNIIMNPSKKTKKISRNLTKLEQLIFSIGSSKLNNIDERINKASKKNHELAYNEINIIKQELNNNINTKITNNQRSQKTIIKILNILTNEYINDKHGILDKEIKNNIILSKAMKEEEIQLICNRIQVAYNLNGKAGAYSQIKFLKKIFNNLLK